MILKTFPISENASLQAYLHAPSPEMPQESARQRPAMILCPGGAYEFCSDREADSPAFAFLNMGLQVFVLRYSTGGEAGNKNPLCELAASIKLVRENARQWQTHPNKILVGGFSAGGHLAAGIGVHWDDPEIGNRCGAQDPAQIRPDGLVLCYPVINAGPYAHETSIENVSRNCPEPRTYWSLETQVTAQTPPAFLWHTMTDDVVPVENSFLFAQQLHRHGVTCECHFFEQGSHGMSTATNEVGANSPAIHSWLALCQTWLSAHFGLLGGEA